MFYKKQLYLFLAIALCFGYLPQSFAQDSSKITLGFGYQNTRLLDLSSSPLLYNAHAVRIDFGYGKHMRKANWSLSGYGAIGNSQSVLHGKRTAPLPGITDLYGNTEDTVIYVLNPFISYAQAGLAYRLEYPIGESGWFLGATTRDDFYFTALAADTWFTNQLSLDANVSRKWKHKQKDLLVSASTTLLNYRLGTPYTKDPSLPKSYFLQYLETGSFFETLNTFQQIQLNAQILWNTPRSTQWGVAYRFEWLHRNQPADQDLNLYSNNLSLIYQF